MLFCPAIKSDQAGHQASQRTSVRLTDQVQGSSRFASAREAAVPRRDEPVSRRGCARAASKGIFPRGAFARAAARDATVKVDRSGPSGNRICYPSVKYAHDRDIAYST